ncbi:MAG TPA: two-component regulator propeller domain-containing protein, partial [Candidatus Eisenbacteria bacterium]
TPNGLARRVAGSGAWVSYQPEAGGLVHPNVWRLLEDKAGGVWAATPEGISRLDADRLTWQSFRADPNALGRDSVLAIAEDDEGAIWLGTDDGAWRYAPSGDGPTWQHVGVAQGLSSEIVLAIVPDGQRGLWFGGSRGIDHFDGHTWRHYPVTTEGLPLGRVFSLLPDHSGNLWAGTQSNGLFRYDRVDIQGFIAPAGSGDCSARPDLGGHVKPILASNCITGLIEDHAGEIWATTADRGAAHLDITGTWSFPGRAPGRPLSDSLSTLVEDRDGRIWFASGNVSGSGRYSGLAVLEADRVRWQAWRGPGALPSDNVLTLHEDASGAMWAGTTAGVAVHAGGAWRSFLAPAAIGFDVAVYAIEEDESGGIWLRTSDGLYRKGIDAPMPVRFGAAEGLWTDDIRVVHAAGGRVWIGGAGGFGTWTGEDIERSAVTTHDVESIRLMSNGDLWVGTDNGAQRIAPGGAATFYPGEVIGSTPVIGLYEDRRHTAWLATFGGMSRFNGSGWNRFGSSDGLVSDQVARFLEDRRGRLWLSSFSGITQYDPDAVAPQSVFVTTPDALTSSRNVRFIHAAAYGEVADVAFRTRLDGLPSEWTPAVSAEFTGLSDGVHTFEVVGRDWSGNVDPTPARFTFEVDATPPEALLAAPSFGQAVNGEVTIRGRAADARFQCYEVLARPAGTAGWNDPAVLTLARDCRPVVLGTLAAWNTMALDDGDWEVRLSVEDTLGLAGVAQVSVIVDNHAPFADVTSPVRVTALDGGDVYTTFEEVHCYFPPRAFDKDAVVTIAPAGGEAWDIAWGEPQLEKPGVIDLGMREGNDSAVLHRSSDGGQSWTLVGGSPDAAGRRLVAIIDAPGRYALLPAGTAPVPSGGLSDPDLIPRVFRPGGGSPDGVSISYRLDGSAPATVRVFNRAGRLVRELAEDAPMGGGVNVLHWDGRDLDGGYVTGGLYLVRVESGGESRVKPLVVLR